MNMSMISIFSFLAMAQAADSKPAENVIARLHHSNWDEALASLEKHGNVITEASPIWYRMDNQGSIEKIPDAKVNDPKLLAILRTRNTAGARPTFGQVASELPVAVPEKLLKLRPVVSMQSLEKFRRKQTTAIALMALSPSKEMTGRSLLNDLM